MKKEKLGIEQAFPILEQSGNPEIWNSYNGISKRLLLAKDIAAGLLSNPNVNYGTDKDRLSFPNNNKMFVHIVYTIVDELLTQENE